MHIPSASSLGQSFRLCRQIFFPSKIIVRYSQYSPKYIDPTFNKGELEKLEEDGGTKVRAFVPVKAARNFEHCSLFYDPLKFTHVIMKEGKITLARELLENTFENIKRIQLEKYYKANDEEKLKIECNPFKILHQAIENCKPAMQLIPVKKGGSTYKVPMEVTDSTARFRAMKWLLRAADEREKKKVRLPEKLAWELLSAANHEGKVIKWKQELYQQCEANRAYAHYRW
uniref:Small ribosomal subunit protein uS7 domain-containing protein n=1 Tax=Strigamia maritima TaxID=126957 RepID=T1JLR3_STRMM